MRALTIAQSRRATIGIVLTTLVGCGSRISVLEMGPEGGAPGGNRDAGPSIVGSDQDVASNDATAARDPGFYWTQDGQFILVPGRHSPTPIGSVKGTVEGKLLIQEGEMR